MPKTWQQWYPHDIESWNSSAAVHAFTDAAYRAYHNLLMAQFESETGMLNPKDLAKFSRMGVRWTQPRESMPTIAEEVMAEFETGPGGMVYSPRMYREWERARDLFEKRSKGGKRKTDAQQIEESSKSDARVLEESSKSLDGLLPKTTEKGQDSTPHIPVPIPIPKEETKATPPQAVTPPADPLPEWVSSEAWSGFVEMRRKIRAPLTPRAITGIVGSLEKLREAGEDPNACLDQSTMHSWRGVFPLKNRDPALQGKPRTIYANTQGSMTDACSRN
jgi:hypothetical protein